MTRKYDWRPTPASRQVEHYAGSLARVRVWDKNGVRRVLIRCNACPWATPSDRQIKGQGSSAAFALDFWADHVERSHPGAVCRWTQEPERGQAYAEEMAERRAVHDMLAKLRAEADRAAPSWHECRHRPATGDAECSCGEWLGPMTTLPDDDPRSFAAHLAEVNAALSTTTEES